MTAVTTVPPVNVPPLMVIWSVDPVPEVMVLPYWSSTLTTKLVQAEPAVAVLGGSVVNTTLVAAVGLTVVDGDEVAVVTVPWVVSEAVKV